MIPSTIQQILEFMFYYLKGPSLLFISVGIIIGSILLYDVPIQNKISDSTTSKEKRINILYNIVNCLLFIFRQLMSYILIFYIDIRRYALHDRDSWIDCLPFVITIVISIIHFYVNSRINIYYLKNCSNLFRIIYQILVTIFITFILFILISEFTT